jgi:hypothetical protein
MESLAAPVARSTLYSACKHLLEKEAKAAAVAAADALSVEDSWMEKSLTSEADQAEIAEIIRCQDINNNGMSCKEAITLIMDWADCGDRVKATSHFAYLVQNKKLPDLKRDGRVVTAQKTTTKRGWITTEQQVHWHGVIESIWKDQDGTNLPTEEFSPLKPHFACNLDETCVMGCEGTIKIIGDGGWKKDNKSVEDNRDSIKIVRIGNSGGSSGQLLFLARGKTMDVPALKNLPSLGVPPNSKIIMMPTAFMTDEAWAALAPNLAKGIRAMPVCICLHLMLPFLLMLSNAFFSILFYLKVIKDYPHWWVVLTLDGYGSHLNVSSALQVLHEHKIHIVKEEGGASDTNQAYDASVAKADKASNQWLLDTVQPKLGVMTQWDLIAMCIIALKKVDKQSWISSFEKVNLHPHKRIPIDQWLKKIDRRIQTGGRFFKELENNLFDAMPAVWRNSALRHAMRLSLLLRNSLIVHPQEKQIGQIIMFGSSLSIAYWMKYPKLEPAI